MERAWWNLFGWFRPERGTRLMSQSRVQITSRTRMASLMEALQGNLDSHIAIGF